MSLILDRKADVSSGIVTLEVDGIFLALACSDEIETLLPPEPDRKGADIRENEGVGDEEVVTVRGTGVDIFIGRSVVVSINIETASYFETGGLGECG